MALLAAWLLILLPLAAVAAEAETTVESIGSSKIYGDKVSNARELAIEDGLSAAVERVAAEQLPIESLIQNFRALDEILFSRRDIFVQGFKVMTETRGADTYRVLVRANISVALMRQELSKAGIMVGERPMPRVVLFLTQRNIGETAPTVCPAENAAGQMPTAAAAMAKSLKARGFTILDPEALGRNVGDLSLDCQPDFRNTQAAEIAADLQADIVIVGKSTAEETAVVTGQDPETGSREALTDAGGLAAASMAPQVLTSWQTVKSAEPITLNVVGTRNLGHFVMFRRALAGIEGVSELQTREMRADEATLVVEYDGEARDLAETLLRIPFDAFGIDITEQAAQTLRVELISG